MWRYMFRGVCLSCKRWVEMTLDAPKEEMRDFSNMKWWQPCPFCHYFNNDGMAFKYTGEHLLDA